MSRNSAICLFLIIAILTIAFTSLLYIPKGNAQYDTFGYNPFLYSLIIPPEGQYAASNLSLIASLITGPNTSPGVRYSQQSLSIQPISPIAAADSSSGMYGAYYYPQGALNLSLANGFFSPFNSLVTGLPSTLGSLANGLSSPSGSYASRFISSNFSDSSNFTHFSYPTTTLTSPFSLANLGNYAPNPVLGYGPLASLASLASLAAAESFATPQVFAASQLFQPYPSLAYPSLANPALPYPTLPYAALQGNLISWPRAEVLTPATSPVAPVYYTYTVVNTFPHDRTAFTEGLVYDNGFLYEGTGIPGRSQVRKVDLLTGAVLQSLDLPSPYFGEGITIYGNTIIELTWQHNIGFVYDKLTFVPLQTFSYPTEGWGLTHDGKNLIMSDGTATLHFLDPLTFAEVGSVDVYDQNGPVTLINELEYIKGEIYANIWLTERIARISPITGQVLGWIDLSGILSPADIIFPIDVLNGIAYDAKNDRLFVTGKLWSKLFEIVLIPLP